MGKHKFIAYMYIAMVGGNQFDARSMNICISSRTLLDRCLRPRRDRRGDALMQFPFDFPFSTQATACPRLTRIAVPRSYFPIPSVRRLFTIDVVLHFSSAAKCSTKARRRSDMIDRPFVKPAIYLGEDGGFEQLRPSYRVRVTHAGSQVARRLCFPATRDVYDTCFPFECV